MFARKVDGQWVTWYGQPFEHPLHPEWGKEWKPSSPELWNDQDLKEAGLYIITQQAVPDGKQAAAWSLTDVNGIPTNIPTILEDPPPRMVNKSTIIERLNDVGLLSKANAALQQNVWNYSRWWAPDKPAINYNDPDAVALLKAIGANPDEILAQ